MRINELAAGLGISRQMLFRYRRRPDAPASLDLNACALICGAPRSRGRTARRDCRIHGRTGRPTIRGRPNSRVTSRHFDYSSASRAFMSRSNRPYGFTCSQISGVSAA